MEEPMSTTITKPVVSGQALLESVGFNRHVAAAIICSRSDSEQEQMLSSIVVDNQRRSVAATLAGIRLSLGLEADYALEISSRES
jgi:hypothetical protein